MSAENLREKKAKHRYTFVIVPDAKSEKTRTFSISRWGFFGMILSTLTIIMALIVATIIYTPFGKYLPISNQEITDRYGKEIVEIQHQLKKLVKELGVMSAYNLHLRKVLGEKFSSEDSIKMLASEIDTTSVTSEFWLDSKEANIETMNEQQISSAVQIPTEDSGTLFSETRRREEDFIGKLPLTLPVSGFEAEGFNPSQFHYGIDFAGKQGSSVLAAADGTVIFADWTYNDGNMIILLHESGYSTVYKHNQALSKSIGDIVKRGEMIALLGNTGEKSRGAHLHFEVWKNGIVQNPNNYLLSIH